MGKTEAVYLVNDYIKADTVLQDIFAPKTINIFPIVADEPTSAENSFPYIRYVTVPIVFSSTNWRVRKDVVQYIVGDTSFEKVGKIVERLYDLLNTDDNLDIAHLPLKDENYKIMSVMVTTGTNTAGPDQEEGVIERGLNVLIIYTKLSPTEA